MPKYKLCPRCEINYILDSDAYCEVCHNELKGLAKYEEMEDEDDTDVCPRCGINFLNEGETICESCLAEIEEEKIPKVDDVEVEKDDWDAAEDEAEVLVDEDADESLEALVDEEWEDDEDTEDEDPAVEADGAEEDDLLDINLEEEDDEEEEDEKDSDGDVD